MFIYTHSCKSDGVYMYTYITQHIKAGHLVYFKSVIEKANTNLH